MWELPSLWISRLCVCVCHETVLGVEVRILSGQGIDHECRLDRLVLLGEIKAGFSSSHGCLSHLVCTYIYR